MSLAHEADWIRYAGVTIAFAGAFIATPDGTADAWKYVRRNAHSARGRLARFLPFLRKSAKVTGAAATITGRFRLEATGRVWRDWDPDASQSQKTEILHRQVDLLSEELSNFRTDATSRLAAIREDLRQTELRLASAHTELTLQVQARDRRAAEIDARGLWPIALGILLTGIPAELADIPALGIIVAVVAVAITVRLVVLVIRSRQKERAAGQRDMAADVG